MVTLPVQIPILRRRQIYRRRNMFRNVRYYRLDNPWPESEEALSEALRNAAFEPCGPLTERSSGWVPVYPDTGDLLARRLNGADLIKLRSQSRLLPPTVVNEELESRIEEYSRRMDEAPSGRDKKRMKAEVRDELMPKALLKSDKICLLYTSDAADDTSEV